MSAEPLASSTVAFNRSVVDDTNSSGITWSAVIGGALTEAALALILLALGAGFGLAMASPWSSGSPGKALGAAGIAWLLAMQIVAAGLGGYLAGRLRSRWVAVHTDEVYFRDTAHGFLAWALGVIVTVSVLASAAGSLLGSGARVNGMLTGTPATGAAAAASAGGYYVDLLLHSTRTVDAASDAAARAEAGRLLAHLQEHPDAASGDTAALSELVAARAGLSTRDADARVTDVVGRLRQAVDDARRAAEHLAFYTFIALLIGAFCASFAATIGGRQRDAVPAIARAAAR